MPGHLAGHRTCPQRGHLRPEEERHSGHAEHGAGHHRPRRRRPEEEARAEQVPEHHEAEEDRDEPGGEVHLAPVDEHVVRAEEEGAEHREGEVVAQPEAERDPAH